MTTITDPRTTLHGRLKAARQFAGLEQADVAQTLGVSRQTVSNWETGRNDIPGPAMIRWAELTRISIAWLGFGTVRPEGFEPPAYCSVVDEAYIVCPYCGGAGELRTRHGMVFCPRCEGEGNVRVEDDSLEAIDCHWTCRICGGRCNSFDDLNRHIVDKHVRRDLVRAA